MHLKKTFCLPKNFVFASLSMMESGMAEENA